MDEAAPILEFDHDREVLIDPYATPPDPRAPAAAVACHFPSVIADVCASGERLRWLPSREPLWRIDVDGTALGVFYPGQGASLAAVVLERVFAAGCRVVVGCGGAGAVVPDLALGHVVVVSSAIRDEGTSYHYLPPAREVSARADVVATLADVASGAGLPFTVAKAWTTDGFFRETRARVARRRAEGAVVVDAEVAALFAVAEFRSVTFGQYLFAGDDVSGTEWDSRGWLSATEVHRRLFDLAAAAAIRLAHDA